MKGKSLIINNLEYQSNIPLTAMEADKLLLLMAGFSAERIEQILKEPEIMAYYAKEERK